MVVAVLSLARILGECSTIHSLPALFCFFKVEIRLCTLIPLLRPGLVTVAQRTEMTVAECSLTLFIPQGAIPKMMILVHFTLHAEDK